jgi:hypothetical protein
MPPSASTRVIKAERLDAIIRSVDLSIAAIL